MTIITEPVITCKVLNHGGGHYIITIVVVIIIIITVITAVKATMTAQPRR
jgi:hypothetical protein